MKEFLIKENDANQRVDKFLLKAVETMPKALMYKYIRTKRIKLNSKRCEISTKLAVGDVLQLYINDEFFEKKEFEYDFLKAPTRLNILYEDENILLVDKERGLVVHEDNENSDDTLIRRILHYLYDKKEFNPDDELSFTPSLCNRIDRNTGGIVICAKNASSLRILNEKIKNRELKKEYLCITVGSPPDNSNTISAFLEKNADENRVYISSKSSPNSKPITTKYKVVDRADDLCLLEVDLITGRTHQIRAHMAYIGCPLLGDSKYGRNTYNRQYKVKTQALYSFRLTFSFESDAGCLNYLKDKVFTVEDVWFRTRFFNK